MLLHRTGERFMANYGGTLYELKETDSISLDPQAKTVDCQTPFVHVFDVSDKTQKSHRFPDSAKRLSTFAHLDRVKLVEFQLDGRRIGITARIGTPQKAVFEHARKTNPMHQPRLICYAPSEPRVLEVKPAKNKDGKQKDPAPATTASSN